MTTPDETQEKFIVQYMLTVHKVPHDPRDALKTRLWLQAMLNKRIDKTASVDSMIEDASRQGYLPHLVKMLDYTWQTLVREFYTMHPEART